MAEGLKLTVEEGKCVQASAYVPADNFTEYHVRDDVDVIFKVRISAIIILYPSIHNKTFYHRPHIMGSIIFKGGIPFL